ncbi:MAG: hypothetical protein ACJAQ3_000434, partial [Planctomycetota bacterium]
ASDLEPGFCDPIQITDTRYDDASTWVDFTEENPRQFRLGVLGDKESWNPDDVPADENDEMTRRLIPVNAPPPPSSSSTGSPRGPWPSRTRSPGTRRRP